MLISTIKGRGEAIIKIVDLEKKKIILVTGESINLSALRNIKIKNEKIEWIIL